VTSRILGEPFRAHDRCRPTEASPEASHDLHLDEVYLKIDGRMVYLGRAVDAEGEVLDGWSSPCETSAPH
jgi:transposase-like protein